jgi:cytoskeleton protein RodZ
MSDEAKVDMSAGAQLRVAREAVGLSVEDVASKLKLSARQIAAIEAEDWSALPERTFTRGFFRSYARLVGIDERLIDQNFARPQPLEMRTMPAGISEVTQENTSARSSWARWLIPASLVVCLLAGLAWMRLSNTPLPQAATKLPIESSKSNTTKAESRPQQNSASPDSIGTPIVTNTLLANTITETEANKVAANSQIVIANPATAVVAPHSSTAPVATPPASTASAPPTPAPAAVPVAAPAAQTTSNNSNIVITPGQRRVVLTVNGRSWTEVRSRNDIVLSETLSNTSKEVAARGPISFVIGNASQVVLTVDGKAYDFSANVRNDVARFRVE